MQGGAAGQACMCVTAETGGGGGGNYTEHHSRWLGWGKLWCCRDKVGNCPGSKRDRQCGELASLGCEGMQRDRQAGRWMGRKREPGSRPGRS